MSHLKIICIHNFHNFYLILVKFSIRCANNRVEKLGVLWKSAQQESWCSSGRKWSGIETCEAVRRSEDKRHLRKDYVLRHEAYSLPHCCRSCAMTLMWEVRELHHAAFAFFALHLRVFHGRLVCLVWLMLNILENPPNKPSRRKEPSSHLALGNPRKKISLKPKLRNRKVMPVNS